MSFIDEVKEAKRRQAALQAEELGASFMDQVHIARGEREGLSEQLLNQPQTPKNRAAMQSILDAVKPPTREEQLIGTDEVVKSIISSAIAQPVSGLMGLLQPINPFMDADTPADAVKRTQDIMTLQPETRSGMQQVRAFGEVVKPVSEAIEGTERFLGETTLDVTGSPTAAAFMHTLPTAFMEAVGLGVIQKMRKGTRLIDDNGQPTKALRKALDDQGLVFENLTPEARAAIPNVAGKSIIPRRSRDMMAVGEDAVKDQVKSGGRDGALAPFMMKGDRVVNDKLGINAVKQGFTPGFIQAVKTATPETKKLMLKMLNISRRIKGNERVSLDIRPGSVVGDAVVRRINFIRKKTSDAANDLNRIANNNLPGKQINTDIVIDQLNKTLADLDIVQVERIDTPVPDLDFKNSIISEDKGSQSAIKKAVRLLSKDGPVDALKAHKLKRQFDNLIDFKKKSKKGLGKEGRDALMALRSSLNEAVRDVDLDYADVNDTLSSSLKALDAFDEAVGPSINIVGDSADSAIGTKMRALTSNINSRVPIENAINQLNNQVISLGGRFKDDIKDLQMMANALDARFGAVAKSSFQGNIEQAIGRVMNQGLAQEAIEQGAGIIGRQVNKLRGINEFNAFEAMDALLKRNK